MITDYQKFIHKSKYARFVDELGRRESWEETVTRYCRFWEKKYPKEFPYKEIHKAILDMEVMPSMRALMTAGEALDRDNIAGYNCSYVPIDHVKSLDEIMYILMCGTGVGFTVEASSVQKLPEIPESFHETDTTIVVSDSRIGWASSFRELLSLLYSGKVPKWDLSRIRSSGSRLHTFGGRASGPEPLDDLFKYTIQLFKSTRQSNNRKLRPIQIHDLVCKIADVVVVGGVRRSALISISDLNDPEMRMAKAGQWWEKDTQRALANNSAVYLDKPNIGVFMDEWRSLYGSKSGERGIFNRQSAKSTAQATGRRDHAWDFGTNPCGEIVLRPNGLCNLSEVIVRHGDSFEELKRKVRLASIIGTFQSTLTDFRYLRSVWKRNAEEERLLGVSLTGIMDHDVLAGRQEVSKIQLVKWLEELKHEVIETNKDYATRLGINQSVATTTVKPSGTVSQLVDSASGIHPRHSSFYIRTARADKKDPLARWMKEVGFPCEDDITKPEKTDVFMFPIKSPEGCITRETRSVIEQLEHYLLYKKHWCEHNVSCTVYVKEDEWIDVEAWVYKHWEDVGGISFLPYDGGTYKQAPYQEISEEKYKELEATMPKNVDWDSFVEFDDQTTSSQELACVGGVCEVT